MADEHMMGAEDDDVQFMRTVMIFFFLLLISTWKWKCQFLGRSYLFKLCACIRCETYGSIRRSFRQSNVLSRRYIKRGRKTHSSPPIKINGRWVFISLFTIYILLQHVMLVVFPQFVCMCCFLFSLHVLSVPKYLFVKLINKRKR